MYPQDEVGSPYVLPVVAEEERVPTAAHAHPEPASEGPSR